MTLTECLFAAGATSKTNRRAGLTLTECLFAAAILAVGVIGILSLVPMSIRQVSSSVGTTVGTAVAKNVLFSLQNRQLDPTDYGAPAPPWLNVPAVQFLTNFLNGTTQLNITVPPAPPGVPLRDFPDLPTALYAYDSSPTCPQHIGDGSGTTRTFKVPGLLPGEPYFTQATWDSLRPAPPVGWTSPPGWPWGVGQRPSYVPVPWARDFGWTATLVPLSMPILPDTQYRCQVAVWRPYRLTYDGAAGLTYRFANALNTVTLDPPAQDPSPLFAVARPGDYIRLDRYGIWYKIEAIDTTGANVTLMAPFLHPAGPLTGPVSVANNFQLVGLYEGVITPRGLRDQP